MPTCRSFRVLLAFLAGTLLALQLNFARAADAEHATVMLVAKPGLQHPLYSSSILIVKPMDNGGHAGFILNKPTKLTLGQVFPEDEPSQRVSGPIFLGGPVNTNVIFALVQRGDSPGSGSVKLTDDLYLAIGGETVDNIIQTQSDHARFFAGAVVWQPGELRDELQKGAWYVLEPDTEVVLNRDPGRVWEDMVTRSESLAKMM